MAKQKIVEAVGVAVSSKDKTVAKAIEVAMIEAVEAAAADGVTDPDAVRERMMIARAAVSGEAKAAVAAHFEKVHAAEAAQREVQP